MNTVICSVFAYVVPIICIIIDATLLETFILFLGGIEFDFTLSVFKKILLRDSLKIRGLLLCVHSLRHGLTNKN